VDLFLDLRPILSGNIMERIACFNETPQNVIIISDSEEDKEDEDWKDQLYDSESAEEEEERPPIRARCIFIDDECADQRNQDQGQEDVLKSRLQWHSDDVNESDLDPDQSSFINDGDPGDTSEEDELDRAEAMLARRERRDRRKRKRSILSDSD